MPDPILIYPDPAVAVRDLIRERLGAHGGPYADATVSTRLPASADPRPYVCVATDGGTRTSRLDARDTVRVNVYDPDDGVAYQLAALIEGIATAPPWPAGVRVILPRSRPYTTADPDTGEPLADLGLTASLAPTQLTKD